MLVGCGRWDGEPDPYDLDFEIPRTEEFSAALSDYGLYEEPMAELQPAERVIPYELSSELFTDYAYKHRLVRVPEGAEITLRDSATLEFPEGTVLAKTFFYPLDMRDSGASSRIIETRLLVKTAGIWNAATYLWNADQTDATLLLEGTTTQVSWIDRAGEPRTTDYVVPHEGECVTCHQLDGRSTFIGPTVQNLNHTVMRDDGEINQLAYLHAEGLLESEDWALTSSVPNYRDESLPVATRARAYLDINCAHCHNPAGWDEATDRDFDFRYATPLRETGLQQQRKRVADALQRGQMPYLGTTLLHDEGIELVLDYLDSL